MLQMIPELAWAPSERTKAVATRLLQWFAFGVGMALVPIFLAWVVRLYSTKGESYPPLELVVSHGELLLVAVAISSAAAGDLIFASTRFRFLKVLGVCGTFLGVVCAIGMFAVVSAMSTANPERVTTSSYWIFALALVCSAGCVVVTEAGRES